MSFDLKFCIDLPCFVVIAFEARNDIHLLPQTGADQHPIKKPPRHVYHMKVVDVEELETASTPRLREAIARRDQASL
jgi:hypothetical protein